MGDEPATKQRLLIVDDSKVIRVTARKILQDHFETVEAVDGENAWELLNNAGPFSLVVSDLTMPNLDGFGLLNRIRSCNLPQIKDLPVIVITGANDSESTKERATQAGATDFIGKPFDSVHLLARTQAHASAHVISQSLAENTIELEDQAQTDRLTGLANEAAFMDRSFEQLSYAVRHKSRLAVFRIEVDDFGDLYKQYGKEVTEAIVKSVATVLESCIRQEDMAARVGAARFSLLLPGMNTAGIRNLADRINRDISARILKQGENRIRYTVSIGVAAPEIRRNTRFDELLAIADSRLVYATSNGGNQVICNEAGSKQPTANTPAPEPVTPQILTDAAISKMINPTVETDDPARASIHGASGKSAQDADEAPTIKSLAEQDTCELPSLFAGPVPDLSTPEDPAESQDNTRTTATLNPAVFDFEHGEEDNIVITAPFGSHDPEDEASQPAKSSANTEAAVFTEQAPARFEPPADSSGTRIPVTPVVADSGDDLGLEQPGFFKRLFSPLARLFRRSG